MNEVEKWKHVPFVCQNDKIMKYFLSLSSHFALQVDIVTYILTLLDNLRQYFFIVDRISLEKFKQLVNNIFLLMLQLRPASVWRFSFYFINILFAQFSWWKLDSYKNKLKEQKSTGSTVHTYSRLPLFLHNVPLQFLDWQCFVLTRNLLKVSHSILKISLWTAQPVK